MSFSIKYSIQSVNNCFKIIHKKGQTIKLTNCYKCYRKIEG